MAEWKAEVLYNFDSTNEVELGLKKGEVVIIRRTSVGDGWYEAERNGARGLIPMKFVRKLSKANSIREERDTNSDDEVVRKTASGEDQPFFKAGVCATSSSSSSSSQLRCQKQLQPTPPLSKKALMEGLLLPETKTMFNPAKAKEIFVDNANVEIVGGPRWEISKTPRKLIIVRDAHAESQSFGSAHTFYEVETKDPPVTVSRRYKHFLWLYDKLAEGFPCLSLPPMPVKQLSGNLEPNFVEARRRGLERFINRVARHPVLGASRVLHEFLTNKDSKEWKIGRGSSGFTLNRGTVKKMFTPAIYSAVRYTPHNYSVSQLSTVDSFAAFTRLVDVNLVALRHSCHEMAAKTGDMTSTLQQVGKDLGKIARGEETVVSMATQQKRSTGQGTGTLALYSQGIHRTAAELEESSGQADFSWGWQPDNKEFQSLVNDVAALGNGIEKIAQRCTFQQDILEQSTVSLLQDTSGILHTVPGVVKVHEEAMKVYENSKEKASKKEAERTKGYCEALSNIVLAEFSYLHSRLLADLRTTFGEMLAQQAEFHTAMAKRWTELHCQFTHTDMPCTSPTVVEAKVDASDGRPMHDYANFQFLRKQAVDPTTSEQTESISYSQNQALLTNSASTGATNSSCSLPNLTLPPCHTHPKDRQGYEQLRQTLGDKFVFSEPEEVVPKTRQEERDEVYVPFTPGHAPSKLSMETSRDSPPLKKKAADYMPFVPISGHKSDPCILDREPALGSGSLLHLQRSSESDPELAQLRSKAKHKERKPFDYLPFVPLAQMAKTASEAQQGKSEEEKECKGEFEKDESKNKESVGEDDEVFQPSGHGGCHGERLTNQGHTTPLDPTPGEGSEETAPHVSPPQLTYATSSCSTEEEGSKAMSNRGNTNSAEESNERHHPVAVKRDPSITEVTPPTRKQGDTAYFVHRIEAGDSSASSGENSPSPRVQSVALSGSMCWNGNSNNNSGVKKGLPPDEAVDSSLKHSGETTSSVHPQKDKETQESTTAVAKNPLQQRALSWQLHKPADATRKHRSNMHVASDRLSTSSYKSTASSSSSQSSPPPHRPRPRKKSRLESLGIVEDTEGGSFAV